MAEAIPEKVASAPRLSADEAQELARRLFGFSGSAEALPSERDQNFRLTAEDGRRFVLKIAGASEDRSALELQNAAMEHVNHKVAGGEPICPEVIAAVDGQTIGTVEGIAGRRHFVRLLSYLPGRPLARANPHTPALLRSLGSFFGRLDAALVDFEHPAARRDFYWDLIHAGRVVEEYGRLADGAGRAGLLDRWLARYREIVVPCIASLRRAVIHSDGNDYNVLAERSESGEYAVRGLLDFGDMVHSCIVHEPAIAAAYAILGKSDPLQAAAQVVSGYHAAFPLTDDELAVLFPLIAMRLCMSVCIAAEQQRRAPDNAYLGISERAAWVALERLERVHPRLAEYTLREACGSVPCPRGTAVAAWLASGRFESAPVLRADLDDPRNPVLDLSVGSPELGLADTADVDAFTRLVFERIRAAGAALAWGRYDEPRRLYTAPQFRTESDGQPESRTIHLGIDLFVEAGTPVFAPLDGLVHGFRDNAERLDYGPTILLEHRTGDGTPFYSLHGHLDASSLAGLQVGAPVERGRQIATVGAPPGNGGWPPHLHFQIIADLLDQQGNFPGVAAPSARRTWLSLCPDPNLLLRVPGKRLSATDPDAGRILQQRRELLSDSLSLSYREPLEIVRGRGTYLYDREGRAYLDCVNNVCHVGHCDPRVVRAGQAQLAVLNTNTRYLHANLVAYTRRLCERLPDPLNVCFLVNSGSEANDLALRLARAHTGRRDVITVEGAYHGHTQALIEISPYKFDGPGGAGRADWVHTVTLPDGYRGPYKGQGRETGARYAEAVREALARSRESGREIGVFICESLPSCAGQIVLPDGYLEQAYAHVRAAGGVTIADEVQVGFGRVGSHFWGFELQGVVPDIVTLGKPIGNGHPLAAVITTREIADSFANGMEYFNTFGGNPVSCAVGLAVLDVIEEEGLQERARVVGARLLAELDALRVRHPIIGDVRGRGLFVGVELVRDHASLEPAAAEATYVVERMKQQGILLSTDGPLHNVLKIKPPLVFADADADALVGALDRVLAEDYPVESA